jgi:acyl-CoA hydrolase
VLTAGIDDLSFEQPIKVGQVVRLTGRVTATFRSSLEIFVDVRGENGRTGEQWPCVHAFVTFVAVDTDGRPTPVPALALETDEERELAAAAAERRRFRLERRGR